MKLSEKIQNLRKSLGLTQEEFAKELFVSRTAVSKWETGRGIPNMDSLIMIAKLGETTLDTLLGAEEIVLVAKEENRVNINRFSLLFDGILNVLSLLMLILPIYKAESDGVFYSVPLYRIESKFALFFWILPTLIAVLGVVGIAIHKQDFEKAKSILLPVGFVLNVLAVLTLILSGQPYPAAILFSLLVVKGVLLLIKRS